MRTAVVAAIFVASTAFAVAGERHWWGPSSLGPLWEPILEHGYGSDAVMRERLDRFAAASRPEDCILDMLLDLRHGASQTHYIIYLAVISHWPASQVLSVLRPYAYTADYPIIRSLLPAEIPLTDDRMASIASELVADVEHYEGLTNRSSQPVTGE